MSFTSLPYFALLGVVLLFLWLVRKPVPQKIGLLVASYVFYAQWDWRFLGLLFGLTTFTFICCRQIRAAKDENGRKVWLALQIIGSLITLGYFKYTNSFIDSLNSMLGSMGMHLGTLAIILPAGISFIVFEVISYTVDVYRHDTPYEESYLDFAILVAFFPHLVAGPILKPKAFLPQLKEATTIKSSNLSRGAQLFLWGVMKKVLVADRVAPFVDSVFNNPHSFNSTTIALAIIGYGIQIYGDFSGYTDMAIGSARMMGYDVPQNFNLPYLAENITDFWRRWHISLSTWLRNYLYIPLGGNRKGKVRTYINLAIVMLLGGLWHGASWNFVVWGGLHGAALALHKLWMDQNVNLGLPKQATKYLSWAVTLVFVLLVWIPFRSGSWGDTATILVRLFTPEGWFGINWMSWSLLLAFPALIIADIGATNWHHGRRLQLSRFTHQLAFFVLALGCVVLAPPAASPFIYFQF